MLYTDLIKQALQISFQVHRDQVDKSGTPYVYHPYTVAIMVGEDELAICVALLHDVIEDHNDEHLMDSLQSIFPSPVIEALNIITKLPGEDYLTDYIPRIKGNALATKVKIADLRHNSNSTRLNTVTINDIERLKTYSQALDYLQSK